MAGALRNCYRAFCRWWLGIRSDARIWGFVSIPSRDWAAAANADAARSLQHGAAVVQSVCLV